MLHNSCIHLDQCHSTFYSWPEINKEGVSLWTIFTAKLKLQPTAWQKIQQGPETMSEQLPGSQLLPGRLSE
jgi:hypothetical protein